MTFDLGYRVRSKIGHRVGTIVALVYVEAGKLCRVEWDNGGTSELREKDLELTCFERGERVYFKGLPDRQGTVTYDEDDRVFGVYVEWDEEYPSLVQRRDLKVIPNEGS